MDDIRKGQQSVGVRANILRTWTRARSTRSRAPGVALTLLAFLALALSACGTTTTNLPSGVYTSEHYHFKVSYPSGWEVNASPQPNAPSPLIVIITRSGTHQPPGSQISSLTIDVLDMSNAGVAKTATTLAKNSALTKTTFGGQLGYSDKPTVETNAGVTLTHSDFYVVRGAYLYQVSTDALAGDGPALNTMAQSFTLTN